MKQPVSFFPVLAALCSCFLLPLSAFAAPDLDLFNNQETVEISSGDTSPTSAKGTDFGNKYILGGSTTQFFKIKNDGTQNLTIAAGSNTNTANFTVVNLPSVIQPITPGTTYAFWIIFDPSTLGTKNATISLTSNDPNDNPFTFDVTGVGTGFPEIVVEGRFDSGSPWNDITDGDDTPLLDDGTFWLNPVATGSSETHTFRVRNTGTDDLTLLAGDNSPHFSVSGLVTSLGPGGSDLFTVTFAPQAAGTLVGTITIANNDSNEDPFTFNVQGAGLAPDIRVNGGFNFSNVISDGDTSPRAVDGTDFGSQDITAGAVSNDFRITNDGNATLDITSATITGADSSHFSISGVAASIGSGGATDVFTVSFNPSTAGFKQAEVRIESNDPDDEDPYTFAIWGDATGTAAIFLEGSSDGATFKEISNGDTATGALNGTLFPNTPVNTNTFHDFRVYNMGTDDLTLSGSGGGAFTIQGLASLIPPGQSDDFQIRFRPAVVGPQGVTITLDNNDPDDDPFTFDVAGTGQGPEITVLGGPSQTVSIPEGDQTPDFSDGTNFGAFELFAGSGTNTFKIVNDGNEPLSVTNVSVGGGSSPQDFALSNFTPGFIPVGGMVTFDVTFDPSATGLRSTLVTIDNNDANENPFVFQLRGTGFADPEIEVSGAQSGNSLMEIPITSPTASASNGTLFPDVAVGSSSTNSFRISNIGSQTLNYSINSSDPQFTIAGQSASLSSGLDDDFTIEFTPTAGGVQSATITINSNDADEDPYTFVVEGTGLVPDIALFGGTGQNESIADGDTTPGTADGTDFGEVLTSSPRIIRRFLIRNEGGADLCVSSITFASPAADFQLLGVNSNFKIVPSGGFIFRIVFDPSSLGNKLATIQITTDDPDEGVFTFEVGGEVVQTIENTPDLEISGNRLGIDAGDTFPISADGTDFGTASQGGAPVTMDFTLTNLGTFTSLPFGSADLTSISAISSNPDVSVSLSKTALRPAETGALMVSFAPTTPGVQFAVISVSSNDPNENPYTFVVQLQVDPPNPEPPTISDFDINLSASTGFASFPTQLNKTYKLTSSSSMAAGTWLQVPGTSTVSGTGNERTIPFTIPLTGSPDDLARYFRIEVE